MRTWRPHLTYANLMATLALFVALGGTGYAATTIVSSQIANGAVTMPSSRPARSPRPSSPRAPSPPPSWRRPPSTPPSWPIGRSRPTSSRRGRHGQAAPGRSGSARSHQHSLDATDLRRRKVARHQPVEDRAPGAHPQPDRRPEQLGHGRMPGGIHHDRRRLQRPRPYDPRRPDDGPGGRHRLIPRPRPRARPATRPGQSAARPPQAPVRPSRSSRSARPPESGACHGLTDHEGNPIRVPADSPGWLAAVEAAGTARRSGRRPDRRHRRDPFRVRWRHATRDRRVAYVSPASELHRGGRAGLRHKDLRALREGGRDDASARELLLHSAHGKHPALGRPGIS